jgi:hypothetical protein
MRQTLAWAAPLGAIALVTGGAAWTAAASSAPDLPDRTPAEVLALAAEADVEQLSGTVRTDADLGLPELPEGFALPGGPGDPRGAPSGDAPGAPGSATGEATDGTAADASPAGVLTRLLSGENSLRVWVDGPGDRFRADLDDPFAGARVVRDGDAVSFWSATDPGTVVRLTAPDDAGAAPGTDDPEPAAPTGVEDLTPLEAAERFVAEADGSTEIRLDDATVVAGRDAYVLVADPRDDDTLVDRLVLAVDGETGLPLRFQVFAVDQRRPAFQTGFTEIDLAAPADDAFETAFPGDATVTEEQFDGLRDVLRGGLGDLAGPDDDAAPGRDGGAAGAPEGVEVVGEGWSAVAVLDGAGSSVGGPGDGAGDGAGDGTGAGGAEAEAEPGAALEGLAEAVDGGRAIRTALVSVLIADDGRVLVGSVPVERLVEVAAGGS